MLKFGTDFYINKKNTVGFSMSGNISNNDRTGDMIYMSSDSAQLLDTWQRISENPKYRDGADFNLFYEKKFDNKDQKLNFDGNYSFGTALSEGIYYENQLNTAGDIISSNYLQQYNQTPDENSKVNFQLDYFHPTKIGKMEMGLKSTIRLTEQSFFQETFDNTTSAFVSDDSLNNVFNYGEQVHAGYFIYGFGFEKLQFQIGLRAEQVFVDAAVE